VYEPDMARWSHSSLSVCDARRVDLRHRVVLGSVNNKVLTAVSFLNDFSPLNTRGSSALHTMYVNTEKAQFTMSRRLALIASSCPNDTKTLKLLKYNYLNNIQTFSSYSQKTKRVSSTKNNPLTERVSLKCSPLDL
jgi:hypothetical protein